ncbi:MAG: acyl-ACP--UDP-N-acetylglucosamine O-acyltransferase [Parachlamydiaceae bacterium]|nr:acyl-ACP--UDP-N-acetylglucosamine O-acyltransferase [Parachlamydiaceae bacterium]
MKNSSKSKIHPLAYVEEGAEIGNDVTIEPFAVVKSNVILKDNVVIKSHAYIDGFTTIGKGTVIYPSASIGTKSQDLKFKGEKTFVIIGENCEIREFVTINSSCQEGSTVSVGNNCLIMAYCHIAHNCNVGNRVIMSNGATLAGHITVDDYAIISGLTAVHQFSRIGCYAMVGGMSRITHDVPPYTLGAGSPYKFGGLNLVGLKRHGFSLEVRKELSKAFRLVFKSGLSLNDAISMIEHTCEPLGEIRNWISFCRDSKRGLIGLQDIQTHDEPALQLEDADEDLLLHPRSGSAFLK